MYIYSPKSIQTNSSYTLVKVKSILIQPQTSQLESTQEQPAQVNLTQLNKSAKLKYIQVNSIC